MTAGALPPVALLAGGLGTRIRALAGGTPKVLLPVEGRPFLAHVLDRLSALGVEKTVLCLGNAAERIWDAAQTHRPAGMTLIASREETPLGTGGAIRRALDELPETFFIMNGDTFLEVPLRALLTVHRRARAVLTLSLVRSEEAAEKGSVRITPEGRVLDFAEKIADGTGLVNAGVYVAQARLFADRPKDRPVSLEREIVPEAIRGGETVIGEVVDGVFVDIGLPESYLRVRDQLPRGRGRS